MRTPGAAALGVSALTLCLLTTGCASGTAAAGSTPVRAPATPSTTPAAQLPTASPAPSVSSMPPSASVTPSPRPTPKATTPAPTHPSASPSAAPQPAAEASIEAVPDSEWASIVSVGAWHDGCPVGQAGLRRVEVNFHGFDGAVHRGVLVVRADVATSVAEIFTRLFDAGYPIHRMAPIEAYQGDDDASMAADNTSAFNCRRAAQANAPPTSSPHANGRAVDLNPYENPWIDPRCSCFEPDARFGSTRSGIGVITKGSLAWQVFTSAGWIWQDSTTTDYQHFDTGYPSRPLG